MVRVAIVEDDPAYVRQLREYLARYEKTSGEKLTITCFSDGDEIAEEYRPVYDVILMDIEMRFMDGMTAATEIRRHDSAVVIIFITNAPQYAIRGYAVDALDYVLKPISYYAFSQRFSRALERMQRRGRRYLYIGGRGEAQKVEIARVLYVEVQGHDLVYHTAEEPLTEVGTLREAEEKIDDTAFFRCGKSFLVNLAHVDGIRGDAAMVAGQAVPISRARKKEFLDALNNYLSEVGK